ncbi:MAG: hypothetical protein Q9M27_02795 [Mariprofundaceae bacterium]|nr:hypothetical protein [Mariprofundaceae bacterium]
MNTGTIISKQLVLLTLTAILMVAGATIASAHGFAGKRFFPTTINVDDPFMNDELSFVFNHIKDSALGGDPARVTNVIADYSKTITKHFGVSIGGTLIDQNPQAGNTQVGFDNIDLGIKYQFFTSEAHEAILSVGSGFSLANTGQTKVGAESFTLFSPTLFFGKGFGDLPDSMGALKPLAITGTFAGNIPSRASTLTADGIALNPSSLSWGFALQYDLNYLQSFVKDIGLPAPFNHMIPVVEFAFDSGLNRGNKLTTGTVNPGILWMGKTMELGVEAQIPINNHSGNNVGFSVLVHFFIDDLFPDTLGHPLFGN